MDLVILRRSGRRFALLLSVVLCLLALALPACTPPAPTLTPTPWVSNTPVPLPSATHTSTPLPTATATPSPSPTVTLTPTLPPVTVGTGVPADREAIIEGNLGQIRELARWGRGRVDALAWSPTGDLIAVATPLGVYLYSAQDLLLQRYFDTNGAAARLAWSADGDLLAVAVSAVPGGPGQDLTGERALAAGVQLWDADAGTLTAIVDTPGLVLAMAFSPLEDVLAVVTRSTDGERAGARAAFYDALSGIEQRAVDLTGAEVAQEAALSADLTRLATRGQDGPVRVWRLTDGAVLTALSAPGDEPGALAFSPDAALLAVAYPDRRFDFTNSNSVRVWRVPSAGQDPQIAYQLRDTTRSEGAEQAILALSWSPDGRLIAAGYEDRTTHVWRAEAAPVFRRLLGVTLPLGLAWSPQADLLAAGGLETFRLEDAVRTGYSDDFIPGMFDLDLSPDGSQLALAEYSQVEVRSLLDGTRLLAITGMDGPVNALDYSPDGGLLVTACDDGTTRLFRSSDGRYLDDLGEATSPVLAVDFSPNGRWIASAGEDMRLRVFRVLDGLQMLDLREPYVSYELAFAPNVDQLASLTTSGVVLRAFGGELQRVGASLQGTVGGVSLHDLVYSPGSEYLALVGNDVIRVIDPNNRKDVYAIGERGGALPWSVAFSPDNAFLAVGWSDGALSFYWAADGTLLSSLQAHPGGVTRVIFTTDGTLLATLGAEDTLRLWGVAPE